MMKIDINNEDLGHGLLGLVMALVEIIRDLLRSQAIRRMDSGRLTEDQINRLGKALKDLDQTIERLEAEQGISETVKRVRDELDQWVEKLVLADQEKKEVYL